MFKKSAQYSGILLPPVTEASMKSLLQILDRYQEEIASICFYVAFACFLTLSPKENSHEECVKTEEKDVGKTSFIRHRHSPIQREPLHGMSNQRMLAEFFHENLKVG